MAKKMAKVITFPTVATLRTLTSEHDRESAVLEALLDIRLFCHVNGLDFYEILNRSYQAYLESLNGTAEKALRESYVTQESAS